MESNAALTNSGWTHIVVTKAGTTVKLYVNAVDRTGTVTAQTFADSASALTIGANVGGGDYLNGGLDEVALYRKALTREQVAGHYRLGLLLSSWPDLVVEVAFDANPLDVGPRYYNVTEYVRGYSTRRGSSGELERIEAGTADVTFKNTASEFDPANTNSPFSGTLKPMKPIRISLDWYGAREILFTGYVEGWPVAWEPGPYSEVSITASDGRALLAQSTFPPPPAPSLLGTWDNQAQTFTDGVAFTAPPNYAPEVWVQVVSDWYADSTPVRFPYTNQTGSAEFTPGYRRLAEVQMTQGARAAAGTRFPLSLVDGDLGIQDLRTGVISAVLGPGRIAVYGQGLQYAVSKTGIRMYAILHDCGLPDSMLVLDPGYSDVSGFTPGEGTDPLAFLDATADAELGQFFFDRAGRATFHDRHHRWLGTAATIRCVFGDGTAGSELPYAGLVPEGIDVRRVRNDVVVQQEGAPSPTRYVGTASITANGRRLYSITVPLAIRQEAQNMANQIGAWYQNPLERFNSLTVTPTANDHEEP